MDRKPGITVLSIIMWFHSINILSGIVLLTEALNNIDVVVGVLVIVSSSIAGIAAYGLWTLKSWSYNGLILFLFSILTTSIFSYMPEEANKFHWSVWLFLLIINILLIYYVLKYVKNNINNYSNKAPQSTPQSGAPEL